MAKKITCFVLSILLLSCMFFALPVQTNAASVRCKKIISVVYDDSGSMQGDNEAYANYSMQTFAAMVNSEDDLYITYMSDYMNSRKIDTTDLLKTVNEIRNHESNSSTPYAAVETAIDRLKQSKDPNPNTQYWLVVFTDGGFNEAGTADVEKALDKFSRTKMENGTEPHIIYMTIGDGFGSFTPHPSNPDIKVIAANNGRDVADSLFDIASSVTGRFRVDPSAITVADDRTIILSSNIPLINISILVQNVDADIVSIFDPDMMPVSIKHEIPVTIPPHVKTINPDITNMHGVITLAGEEGKNIPAGRIMVTLSKAIRPDDIVVMIEPAIELKIKFYSNGQEIPDPDQIAVTTPGLIAKAAVYEYGTDTEILESLLPGGYTKTMEHSIDNRLITSVDSFIIDPLETAEGNNRIHAVLDLEGFFHLETAVEFAPVVMQIDSITAELDYDGSPRRIVNGIEDGQNVVYVTRLKDNRTGYRFTVSVDGEPIDKQTALSLEERFREGIHADFSNYTVEVMDDGSFLVYPSKQPWYIHTLVYALFNRGEKSVGVTMNGVSAKGTLVFKPFYDITEIIAPLLTLLLILYIIWWILFKKHFPRVTLCMGMGSPNQFGQIVYNNSDQVDLNWLGCFQHRNIVSILFNLIILLFPMPSKTRFGGYTFTGQRSLVRSADLYLTVRNVKNKAVSSTATKPNEISESSYAELEDQLYIRDGASYIKFWFED